jgi:ADP-heptose:LPS heptosyltransferase
LAALRRQFPAVHLELLGYPRVTPLALAGGLVDQVQSIEARSLASFFAKGGELPESLADYFASFALIISYLYDPDLIFQENVARCSSAQFISGPHRPDENAPVHAAESFLKPLERLAIYDADPEPKLNLALYEAQARDTNCISEPVRPLSSPVTLSRSLRSVLALHPGSGSEKKNWPESKWHELVTRLVAETSWSLLLVGGEAEQERLNRLAAVMPSDRTQIAQNLPLVELGRLLSRCAAYVGHDSGISHLAAALGLPGLVLWGETQERVWRPRSGRMALLRSSRGLANLAVPEVFARLKALLEANHC